MTLVNHPLWFRLRHQFLGSFPDSLPIAPASFARYTFEQLEVRFETNGCPVFESVADPTTGARGFLAGGGSFYYINLSLQP